MTTTIPDEITLPDPADHLPKSAIRVDKYRKIVESLHYCWQRTGLIMPGMVFDPAFQTTSTTFTGENDTGDLNLSSWVAGGRLQKLNPDGNYVLSFRSYIQDITQRFLVYRFDGRVGLTLLGTVDLVESAGESKWVEGTITIAEADAYEGGNTANPLAVLYVYTLAKVPSGTGYIWQF